MEIRKVTCVGAGLIGQGWATVFSSNGYPVLLQDITQELLERAMKGIHANLTLLEANGFIGQGEAEAALGRIKTTLDLASSVHDADYVQESVPDSYDIKHRVFREMDEAATEHAILASSSSGLLMTEIQKAAKRPERCVMAHPMLPVHLLPAVEVVGGAKTDPEITEATCAFMRNIGKVPVLLKKEASGYIVNRLQAAILREAIDLVYKGVASAEDVDKAFCMGIGLRDPFIGPFLRIHLAGNGVESFLRNYAESYRYRWESMESWTSVPPSAEKAVIESVNRMDLLHTKSLDEIKDWRDRMLVEVLKVVQGEEGSKKK